MGTDKLLRSGLNVCYFSAKGLPIPTSDRHRTGPVNDLLLLGWFLVLGFQVGSSFGFISHFWAFWRDGALGLGFDSG